MKVMELSFYLLLFTAAVVLLLSDIPYYSELFACIHKFYDVANEPISVLNNFEIINDMHFEGFNNETGVNRLIVPNIIHYIRLNKRSWTFVEYVCLLSAFVNHNPEYIFIHTNVISGFKGKYWGKIQKQKNLQSRIVIYPIQIPLEIFGKKLKNNNIKVFHASDIIRIQILMRHGGFFFDNDAYVVQNLDKYRKYEMTLGWPKNRSLGTMVLVANKNARFLPLWLDNYRNYKDDEWYYNAGDNPTKTILMEHPELVHREETRLGIDFKMRDIFQSTNLFPIANVDTVHLLINHRFYLDCFHKDYRYFNERNILHYPFNFGEMVRFVLNKNLLLDTNQTDKKFNITLLTFTEIENETFRIL